MSGPARHRLIWRGAALAVLGGGIGLALWRDPALLERRDVTLPLALGFAALWMVPALRRPRPAPAEDPGADRAAIDLGLGGLAGLVAGALYLSVPGSAALLSRGPQAVGWAYDRLGPEGGLAFVAAALVVLMVARTALEGVFSLLRSSRFAMGLVMGLFLWLPFHGAFAAALARLGLDLPGLQEPQVSHG